MVSVINMQCDMEEGERQKRGKIRIPHIIKKKTHRNQRNTKKESKRTITIPLRLPKLKVKKSH